MPTTFKEIVQAFSPDLAVPVDEITEGNPLFQTATFQESNRGMVHLYEKLEEVIAAEAIDFTDAYGNVDASFTLKDKSLAFFAGLHEVHTNVVDEAYGGSFMDYLAKKMPVIYQQTLNNISFDTYYSVLRPFAKAENKLLDAGGNSGENNSLFVCRWQEDQLTGLINGNWAQERGGVFIANMLSGGERYNTGDDKPKFGATIELPVGYLPANSKNISGIVNVDLDSISDEDLSRLVTKSITMARPGAGGRTVAYAHPYLVSRIGAMREAKNAGLSAEGLYLAELGGVEIVGDWNLSEKEADYTV